MPREKNIYRNRKQINDYLELGVGAVIDCKDLLGVTEGSKIEFW